MTLALARCRRLTFDLGVDAVLPDNPEAAEGYDPAVPIIRDSGGESDSALASIPSQQQRSACTAIAGESLHSTTPRPPQ